MRCLTFALFCLLVITGVPAAFAEDDPQNSEATYGWSGEGYCVLLAPGYDPPVAVDPSHCTLPAGSGGL